MICTTYTCVDIHTRIHPLHTRKWWHPHSYTFPSQTHMVTSISIVNVTISQSRYNNLCGWCERNTNLSGMMKWRRDHNSCSEFCNGVPVMRILWFVSNVSKDLYNRESSFFNRWASSTPRKAQDSAARKACHSKEDFKKRYKYNWPCIKLMQEQNIYWGQFSPKNAFYTLCYFICLHATAVA